ncbi:hypothetical protein [Arsenophonus sp. ENCA]|uniref:hypothetical protein n=1 Tax=Arsenophonus sp. ENCA TaxID=1987579 RepID=UPI0025BE4048|nr:hypothetical protein [Arsenophonus sp. ENCA]
MLLMVLKPEVLKLKSAVRSPMIGKIYAGYTQFLGTDSDGKRINRETPNRLFKLFSTYTLPGVMNNLTIGGGVNWQRQFPNEMQQSKSLVIHR